jgi:hypothetical protein
MRRFTLVSAAVVALTLLAANAIQAGTMSQGMAAAVAVQATGFHHGPPSHGWSGGHRGPEFHRPPVVAAPMPQYRAVWAPPVVYPPVYPTYYYAVPQSGFTYQGRNWALSFGF